MCRNNLELDIQCFNFFPFQVNCISLPEKKTMHKIERWFVPTYAVKSWDHLKEDWSSN